MLSWRKVWRGVFARFLPACLVTSCALAAMQVFLFAPAAVRGTPPIFTLFAAVALRSLLSSLPGFGLGLVLIRRWLDPETPVDGRPSVVAGLVMPLGLWAFSMATAATVPLRFTSMGLIMRAFGAPMLVGALVAVGMFFPWLSHAAKRSEPPLVGESFDGAMSTEPLDEQTIRR